jgi:hypothetical protein
VEQVTRNRQFSLDALRAAAVPVTPKLTKRAGGGSGKAAKLSRGERK